MFWRDCDVIAILGLQLGALEALGEPPTWPAKAKRIIINESTEDAWNTLPTELNIIGNAKIVLRQMIECAKDILKEKPQRTAWLGYLDNCRREHAAWQAEVLAEFSQHKPIHAVTLAQDIVDFLDPSATYVYDAFAGTSYLTERVVSKFAGQILDCGSWGGVGHGVGMGIGAQLARPGKQVLALMGDGGFGISAMDVETAARHKLPIVFVICNNSTWMAGPYEKVFKHQAYPWDMLPDIRYDKMCEMFDCHGENVVDPGDIRPALERAFNSGKTSVVNVLMDPRVNNPWQTSKAFTITVKLCADSDKFPEDWERFNEEGPTLEVIEELRARGEPIPKPFGGKARGTAGSKGFDSSTIADKDEIDSPESK